MSAGNKIFLVVFLLAHLSGCSEKPDNDIIIDDDSKIDWVDNADKAFGSLVNLYWDENRGIFFSTNYRNTTLNYWWQAHALDALVDASQRVGDDRYFSFISKFHNGVNRENGGFINDFYDDMCWMGIALVRSYLLTGEGKYLDTAKFLWQDILTGWNESQGGGICWNKQMTWYKNTPSNATAAILSFMLFGITGENSYLDRGKDILIWLNSTLVDAVSGMAWDGIGRNGDQVIDKNWLFTYNQGIYIGACIHYYNITGETAWLERAVRTADNALIHFRGKLNVLKDEGTGDGGLFKGILIRYLKFLADQEYLPGDKYISYSEFIRLNAECLWDYGKSPVFPFLFNHDWTEPPLYSTDLSVQLSGVFLLEANAAL